MATGISVKAKRPTVRPAVSFDAAADAASLKKAMKGLGTDEKLIIQVLGRRTSQQRQEILHTYNQLHGKDLIAELKKELSGNFEDVIVSLMTPMPTYLAQELNKAMKGLGTNEKTLIEILCTNDNKALHEIKTTYETLYGKPLLDDLKSETSGDFSKLLLALASGDRSESALDRSLATSLAQSLFKAGEKKRFGTEESEFTRIVGSYSLQLLRFVFEDYEKVAGHSFDKAITSELSGDYREGVMAMYSVTVNEAAFFAQELEDAMKGIGTKKAALARIIITRSEIDMGTIKEEYKNLFAKKLEDAIASEVSGDFKKILLALIQD